MTLVPSLIGAFVGVVALNLVQEHFTGKDHGAGRRQTADENTEFVSDESDGLRWLVENVVAALAGVYGATAIWPVIQTWAASASQIELILGSVILAVVLSGIYELDNA